MQNKFLLKKINLTNIFFINLFLISGIILSRNNINNLFIVFFLVATSALYYYALEREIKKIILCPIIFAFGILSYKYQDYKFHEFADKHAKKPFNATCVIYDITLNKSGKKSLILKLSTGKKIKLTLNKYLNINDLQVGDEIHANNLFFKYPNKFLRDTLIKDELSAYATSKNFHYKLVNRPSISLNRYFKNLRTNIFANLKQKLNPETFALFSSIFLGNKTSELKLLYKFKAHFNDWGLAHYLARSGLHLVIIFLFWFLIISILPVSYYIKQVIIFFIIFIYALLSWSSIPFIRSLITFMLYKICILLDLQINALHCLNLACIGMLLYNPIQLFFLDFQLSFALTFALIWINSFNIEMH